MDGCAESSIGRHVLGLNVFLGSIFTRRGCAGILLLLFAFTRGHSRIEPLVAWLIAIVACGLIGTALKLDPDAFMSTSARSPAGRFGYFG